MRTFVDATGKEIKAANPSGAARKSFKGGNKLDKSMKEKTVTITEKATGKKFAYKCSVIQGKPFTRTLQDGTELNFSGLSVKVKAI